MGRVAPPSSGLATGIMGGWTNRSTTMTVNHILTDLGFSKDIKVREEALESLTRRITEASVSDPAGPCSLRRQCRPASGCRHQVLGHARSAWWLLRRRQDPDHHQPRTLSHPEGPQSRPHPAPHLRQRRRQFDQAEAPGQAGGTWDGVVGPADHDAQRLRILRLEGVFPTGIQADHRIQDGNMPSSRSCGTNSAIEATSITGPCPNIWQAASTSISLASSRTACSIHGHWTCPGDDGLLDGLPASRGLFHEFLQCRPSPGRSRPSSGSSKATNACSNGIG